MFLLQSKVEAKCNHYLVTYLKHFAVVSELPYYSKEKHFECARSKLVYRLQQKTNTPRGFSKKLYPHTCFFVCSVIHWSLKFTLLFPLSIYSCICFEFILIVSHWCVQLCPGDWVYSQETKFYILRFSHLHSYTA